MNGSENGKTKGSIIAIDELDMEGNVVYSTTVDKKLVNNPDFYFVDVENCTELDLSEEDNEVRNTIECGNITDLKEPNQLLNKFAKRKRRVITLSDHDCVIDEFVVRNE